MSLVIQGILGVLELTVILVYCVICQVNEHVVNVGIVKAARLEFLGGKADDALMVEEDLQGVAGSDQYVEADVKFQVIYQEGLLKVLLHNDALVRVIVRLEDDIVYIVGEEDTLALTQAVGFHNVRKQLCGLL